MYIGCISKVSLEIDYFMDYFICILVLEQPLTPAPLLCWKHLIYSRIDFKIVCFIEYLLQIPVNPRQSEYKINIPSFI